VHKGAGFAPFLFLSVEGDKIGVVACWIKMIEDRSQNSEDKYFLDYLDCHCEAFESADVMSGI